MSRHPKGIAVRRRGVAPGGRQSRGGPLALALVLSLLASSACEFLDPTQVENPRTTSDDLADAREPTAALLPGLRAQFARAIGSNVVIAEVVSDNYSIHGTGLAGQYDDPGSLQPSIMNSTSAATGSYWNLQELRALADFVLNEIVPADASATAVQRAELLYYRGMALLIMGENHAGAPLELNGSPLPWEQLVERGISDLHGSIGAAATGPFATAAGAALARAHRLVGNASAATAAAEQLLSSDPNFLFRVEFDESGVINQPYIFLVERALKEMQPLPRLDFLDPKYTSRAAGIPVAKAEEMQLILAEAAFAGGNFQAGRGHLADAIRTAQARPLLTFTDTDQRLNSDLTIRPRSSTIEVRADAESPWRGGLILDRPNRPIEFSAISGTSLNPDSIGAIPLGETEALWHALHLARQEILMLEGRRMSDLGIRLPMMLREIDANPNLSEGDVGTVVIVPSYIPPQNRMDLFSPASPYDAGGVLQTTQVTILHDLNRVLARNRVTPFD